MNKLIPIKCFLNRVFPISFYEKDAYDIINNRIFKPRKDCKDFILIFPLNWEAKNRMSDRNWRMQLQGFAMFHPIMNFFDKSDEKEKIIDYFFEVCNDWNSNYGDDPDDVLTTRMPDSYAWYDMSVGFRALVLAFFINRIKYFSINISEENKIILNKLARKHINHLRLEKVFSLNNHGMFQIQGLMALIQLEGIEKYKTEYQYALDQMEALVLSQYDNNGIHLEHSPHYHFYALTTFENILINHWYDEKPIIKIIVKKANATKKWLVDPYKRPACVGDSILTVQKNVDFDNQDFSDDLEIVTDDNQFVYSNFNETGYSIFRTNWDADPEKSSYLFFMGMYNRKTHKHRDCLSFEWFDNGEKILCDSGKYGYVSDKYRKYFLSNRAHNTVEIEGFDILKIKPYGSAIKSTSYKNELFILNAKLDYPAIQFERTLTLKAKRWIIIEDNLNFKKARKVTQWFHLEKSYKLINLEKGYSSFRKDKNTLIIHCLNEVTSSIYYGDNTTMQGFVSENDFVYDEAFALGFSCHTDDEKLVTIVALDNEAYSEALAYIKNENIYKTEDTQYNEKIIHKPLIKNIKHYTSIDSSIEIVKGKQTHSIFQNNMRFDFFINKIESKKIVIMLPGAIDRTKLIYNFQRYSWSDEFDYSMISVLDPTIRENNNLGIGWFQGLSHNYGIDNFIDLMKTMFKNNNIEESDIIFFGSSAGGFSSLKLANVFPTSKIIAINPQIYVYEYSQNEYKKLLLYVYANKTHEEVLNLYKERLSINIDFNKRKAPIYYFQNVSDQHHLLKHLNPFLEKIKTSEFESIDDKEKIKKETKLYIFKYDDPESGHSPPNKDKTLRIINDIVEDKVKKGFTWIF